MLLEFQNNKVRCELRGRRMWFVGKDIMTSLGYENPEKNLPKYIEDEDTTSIKVKDTLGRTISALAINTYAVYKLLAMAEVIKTCDTDTIKAFKHWLDEVVQPIIDKSIEKVVSDEDMAILKIVHAKSDTEKASSIKEFKELIIQQVKVETKKSITGKKVRATEDNDINLFSVSEVTETLGLKKGQILRWASNNGMFGYRGSSGKSPFVSDKGYPFFRIYNSNTTVGLVGVTDAGIKALEEHIEEIRNTKLKYKTL